MTRWSPVPEIEADDGGVYLAGMGPYSVVVFRPALGGGYVVQGRGRAGDELPLLLRDVHREDLLEALSEYPQRATGRATYVHLPGGGQVWILGA